MKKLILIAVAVLMLAVPATGAELVLEWDAPTTNSDGTPLTDLAGFKVYSHVGDAYNELIDIPVTQTTTTISNLTPGLHCFVATAYDGQTPPNESTYSNEVCADLLAPASFQLRIVIP